MVIIHKSSRKNIDFTLCPTGGKPDDRNAGLIVTCMAAGPIAPILNRAFPTGVAAPSIVTISSKGNKSSDFPGCIWSYTKGVMVVSAYSPNAIIHGTVIRSDFLGEMALVDDLRLSGEPRLRRWRV